MDDVNSILKKNKFHINPFKKGLKLAGQETYHDPVSIHKILDIKLIFEYKKCRIKFRKKDYLMAMGVLGMFINDPYGKDKIICQYNQTLFDHNVEYEILLEDKIKDLQEINEIKIEFTDNEILDYRSQVLIYTIDRYHDDNYWFEIEYSRGLEGSLTDEEV